LTALLRALDLRVDRLADLVADRLDAFNRSVDPIGTAPTDPSLHAEVDALLAPALRRDFAQVHGRFRADDEYVCVEQGLPPEAVERVRREIIVAHATRSAVPWYRKAGSVGWRRIQNEAPFTAALYRSAAMREYVSTLCGKTVFCKSDDDDHACTYYVYSKPGDHMNFHYDVCGCEDAASYSLIIGIVDDSTQKLMVELHRGDASRPSRSFELSTPPGLMITFAGSKVWHGVSRLGRGELRVSLGLAYAANNRMPPKRRLVKVMADTLFHFGLGGFFRRRRPKALPAPASRSA
jgi:hypothetical protein